MSIKVTEPDFVTIVILYFITVLYCFFRISGLRNFFYQDSHLFQSCPNFELSFNFALIFNCFHMPILVLAMNNIVRSSINMVFFLRFPTTIQNCQKPIRPLHKWNKHRYIWCFIILYWRHCVLWHCLHHTQPFSSH